MLEAPTWIVGMDLTPTSHGAVRLARWLSDRSRPAPRMRGVFVGSTKTIERELPGARLPGERARMMLRAAAESLGATAAFEAFEAVPDDSPEEALARLAETSAATGIIVGRAGPASEWTLVSLGRVARRLLRHAPCPVMVAPPDLDVATLGRGPVVIGAAATDDAVSAVRFGHALAQSLGLATRLVQIIPDPAALPVASVDPTAAHPDVPVAGTVRDRARLLADAERTLGEWLRARGLPELPMRTELGRKAWTLLDVARAEEATLLVCGSRRLSLAERIFDSSVGSQLAAQADRPVLVVPPHDDEPLGSNARS
jgi:nucleotide-binding universal stress UspA family protein